MTALTRNVAVYVVGSGEILKTLGGSDQFIAENTPAGCAVIDAPLGLNEHLNRVDESSETPTLVARTGFAFELPSEIALGAVVALDAPAGAVLAIDGEPMAEADDDGLEIEFASPGVFWAEITLWPYAPLRQRIRVD